MVASQRLRVSEKPTGARGARSFPALLVLAWIALGPATGHASWTLSNGVCLHRWSPGDVTLGPRVVLNGALLPLRSTVGGVGFAAEACAPHLSCAPLAPLWIVASTAWGLGEGLYWIATGTADTLTFGTQALSPLDATRLRLHPLVPMLRRDHLADRCR
jgi:hypothetical protein